MVVHQISDPVDAYVGRRILRHRLGIAGVVTLVHKHRCDAGVPDLFDGVQDAQFVMDHDIVLSRIPLLDVLQLMLLMHIDKDVAVEGLLQSGAINLVRLKNDVIVGENHRRAPLRDMLYGIDGTGEQTVRKRVADEEIGDRQ